MASKAEGGAQRPGRGVGGRACETAGPSGVPYGGLLEATRATMAPVRGTPFVARVVLTVFRHHVLLRAALLGARAFRTTGLPRVLARVLPKLLAFTMPLLASTPPVEFPPPRASQRNPEHRQTATRQLVTPLTRCDISERLTSAITSPARAPTLLGPLSCHRSDPRTRRSLHCSS